jgi:hypothetical protein
MSNALTSPEDLVSWENSAAPDATASDALNKLSSQINEIRGTQSSPEVASACTASFSELPSLTIEKPEATEWAKLTEKSKAPWSLEPLSRTEKLLLNGLTSEATQGSVSGLQEMLGALAENPNSAARILDHFNQRMNAENPLRSADYIIGKDSNGKPFIQLSMSLRDNEFKGSPITTVTMDNRGQASGARSEYSEHVGRTVSSIKPSNALRDIVGLLDKRR